MLNVGRRDNQRGWESTPQERTHSPKVWEWHVPHELLCLVAWWPVPFGKLVEVLWGRTSLKTVGSWGMPWRWESSVVAGDPPPASRLSTSFNQSPLTAFPIVVSCASHYAHVLSLRTAKQDKSFIPSVTSFMYYITRMGKVTKKFQENINRVNVAMPTKSNTWQTGVTIYRWARLIQCSKASQCNQSSNLVGSSHQVGHQKSLTKI